MLKKKISVVNSEREGCLYYVPTFPLGYESKELEKGARYTHLEEDYHILFVLEGELSVCFDVYEGCPVKSGEMFYLHATVRYEISVLSPIKIIEIRFNHVSFPCTDQGRSRLLQKLEGMEYKRKGSPIKEEVRQWLNQIIHYGQTGLSCSHILDIKNREFYLLMKHYYTDEEKIQFFHFTAEMKSSFHESVLVHYSQVKTVQEFAARMGYGIKTFRTIFKAHFGANPHKWMQEQTALRLKVRLMDKNVSLKQIMFEFQFDSSSHFYHYCRKQFGATPTQIRNRKPQE